jgi:hypothetical protein
MVICIFNYQPIYCEVPLQTILPTNIILLITINGTNDVISQIHLELPSCGAKTRNLLLKRVRNTKMKTKKVDDLVPRNKCYSNYVQKGIKLEVA